MHSIPKVYKNKFQIVYNTCSKILQSPITAQNVALHSSSIYGILKHSVHIIIRKTMIRKTKYAVKFVKGLPHLCPCHQPNTI